MAERDLPEGTVTLVLTDIEGSTTALHRLGRRYGESLELHRRIVREAATSRGGVEVDTQGDAFLFAFPRADDALDAATQLVAALGDAPWPAAVPLPARVGVHTGDLERISEGYVGLELHRAARICACAHGGQIVVSAATRALGADRRFLDLGHQRLKGFDVPERLFQLLDDLATTFPPLRTQAAKALPRVSGAFVNRLAELEEIRRLLTERTRLVTLVGAGGAGKSRLALEAAHASLELFAHGVSLARLAPVEDVAEVPVEIAAALGIPPGVDPEAAVVDHLREREVLIVLDNLEHVQGAAPFLGRLLVEAPGLSLLGTSRSPLRIAGEQVLEVDPLDERAAVELFAERARSADARFTLDDRTEDDVRAVCRRVDGLPLAIEIVAARVVSVSVHDMAEGLGFGLTTTGASDAPDRHRTLEAAIEWGAGILDERLRRLHASLGVFQSRFTPEAASFAFGATFDDLDVLVRSALLRRVDDGGPTRLAMLQTVREFARARLVTDARSDEARDRRAAWIEELAARAAPRLDAEDRGPWLVELEHWAPDIRATLREAVQRGDHARCVRITSSLERFWRARGEVGEARAILAEALGAAPPADPAARARASWTLARLAAAQGDARGAEAPLREALALYRAGGFARETAFALTELAWGALDLGELAEAEARAEEALDVARTAADDRATSSALSARAAIASEHGDPSTARACAEESLAIRRRLGDRQLVANAALTLGSAALAEGDLDGAGRALDECLELAEAMGDVLHAAGARCCLGEIAALRGDRDTAAEQLLPALATFVRLGNDAAAAECLVALAATRDDDVGAARLLGAAAAARERLGVAPVPTERRLERQVRSRLGATSRDDGVGRDLSLADAALLAGVEPSSI